MLHFSISVFLKHFPIIFLPLHSYSPLCVALSNKIHLNVFFNIN